MFGLVWLWVGLGFVGWFGFGFVWVGWVWVGLVGFGWVKVRCVWLLRCDGLGWVGLG